MRCYFVLNKSCARDNQLGTSWSIFFSGCVFEYGLGLEYDDENEHERGARLRTDLVN